MKRLEATVHGRVQGVSFRHYTWQQAQQLALTGWVCNQPDGTVSLCAEGAEASLQQFLARLQQGPPLAQVSQIQTVWGTATAQFKQFSIRW